MKKFIYLLTMTMVMMVAVSCGDVSGDPKIDAPNMIKELGEAIANGTNVDQLSDEICEIQVKYSGPYVKSEELFNIFRHEVDNRHRELKKVYQESANANRILANPQIDEAFQKGCQKAEVIISIMIDGNRKPNENNSLDET